MTVVIHDRDDPIKFNGEYAFYNVPAPFVDDVKEMLATGQKVRDTGLAVICIPNLL